ncbi:CTLH/CRA C-terminal to lish motif domain-containing protein, partial [Dimargaris cristalligena]
LSAVKLESNLKRLSSQTTEKHKELYNNISKHGKFIEKAFKNNLNGIRGSKEFESGEELVVMSIALDFIRQGQFELACLILKEAGLEIPHHVMDGFKDMFSIVDSLKKRDLDPALRWAQTHRDELGTMGSDLEFNLHKMRYIHLLTQGQHLEALRYSKEHMSPFNAREKYFQQIKKLSGSVLYAHSLESSPYGYLLSPSLWTELEHNFTSSFCKKLGLADRSPLYLSVTMGVMALPAIIKMSSIMKEKRAEWSQQDELPVEVSLPEDLRFHSTFICPVSKERATDTNPPMMLPCGHVICHESLNRLYKAVRQTTRFKCPYCPAFATAHEAERVYF